LPRAAAVQGRRDGVESRRHLQEEDVEHLVAGQRRSLDLGLDQAGCEIVCRLGDSAVEEDVEVGVHLGGALLPQRAQHGQVVTARNVLPVHERVLPRQELVQVLNGKADHVEEHTAGERNRERLVEIGAAVFDDLFQHLLRDGASLVGHRPYRPRREQRVEQLAVLRVVRRIDVQRNARTLLTHLVGTVGLEQLRRAQCLADVLVTRQDDDVAALRTTERRLDGRGVIAQTCIDRPRIIGQSRIGHHARQVEFHAKTSRARGCDVSHTKRDRNT